LKKINKKNPKPCLVDWYRLGLICHGRRCIAMTLVMFPKQTCVFFTFHSHLPKNNGCWNLSRSVKLPTQHFFYTIKSQPIDRDTREKDENFASHRIRHAHFTFHHNSISWPHLLITMFLPCTVVICIFFFYRIMFQWHNR
jgi:hypothetical protein